MGIGYGDDIERVRRIMMQAVERTDEVQADPARDVLVMVSASSSVTLRVRWWIAPPASRKVSDAMRSPDGEPVSPKGADA